MTRLEANKEIMKILAKAVVEFPDQRFGQILMNFDIIGEIRDIEGNITGFQNVFNVESIKTLEAAKGSALGLFLLGKLK